MRTGELVASLGGVALFVVLFFDWIGAEGSDEGVSGWDYLGADVTGFLVFLAAITAVTLGIGAATGRRNPLFGWRWGGPTTVLGALAFDVALWRMFTVPDGGELSIGIFLGLIAAAAVTAGGYMTLQDGGSDPLGIGGGSSPTATTARATATKKPAAKRKPAAKGKAAARRA
jgi:hypothetical protein